MNTRSKRASSVGFWKPYVMALPLPDGAISQGDRQHSAWDYSGILAGATAAIKARGNGAYIPYRDKRAFIAFRDKRVKSGNN